MDLKNRLDALRRQAGAAAVGNAGTPATEPAGGTDQAQASGPGADLRARLQRLGGRAAPGPDRHASTKAGTVAEVPQATRPIRGMRRQAAAGAGELAERLGGERVAEHLVLVETRIPLQSPHGRWRLAEALEPLWPLVAPFPTPPPQAEAVPGARAGWSGECASIVGIDTETTGLAGGTGTAAFMVGIAEAGPAHVRLRQWLLTAFSGEAAMLAELAASLAGAGLMVSYNGKTFDLPLLRDRRRLLRQPALPEPPHLDLLHPTRRLFRGAWPDCRLATAEQRLLGLFREDDLPGSEAPRAWRDYLAGDSADDLERVLRHNALDVLSLLLLGPALVRALHDPAAFGAEALAAADTWSRRGEPARALSVLEASRGRLDTRGELELAWALRGAGRWAEATTIWERLARGGCAEAVERLAKYHEHVRGDWSRALDYANRLEEGPEAGRRRQRLHRRLATTQGRLDL
jgi:hypothetical protein